MPINFGILQQGPAPQTSAPRAEAAPLLSPPSAPQGDSNMAQQMATQALLPGELKQQQATLGQTQAQTGLLGAQTQNAQTAGQISQMQLQGGKLQVQQNQERIQAYNDAKAKGGTESGLDAVQEKLYEQGHIHEGLNMVKTRETLKQQIADDDKRGVASVTGAVYGTMQRETPPTKDPKTGQVIPGKTALQNYSDIYPTLKKEYPRAPDPSTFKGDNNLYKDTFVHPVLDTARNYLGEEKVAHDELVKNDMYKAQGNVKDKTDALKSAVSTYGASSQEAKDAAIQVQQAQQDASRVSTGSSFINSMLHGGYKSVFDEPEETIQKYTSTNSPAGATPITSNDNATPVTKTLGGVDYIMQNGKWYTK